MYLCITLGVLWNNFESAKEERSVGMGNCEVKCDNKDVKRIWSCICRYYIASFDINSYLLLKYIKKHSPRQYLYYCSRRAQEIRQCASGHVPIMH